MDKVKSAFEKAMERAAGMGEPTSEEKEAIRAQEKVKSLLAAFFRRQIGREELWQQLRGADPATLRDAQTAIADSMRLTESIEDIKLRRDGILAIETLKERQNTSAVEGALKAVEKTVREYHDQKQQALDELRKAIESDPRLRMRPVRTPDGKRVYQASVSVDEAVQQRFAEFVTEHEKRYEELYGRTIERLKKELR